MLKVYQYSPTPEHNDQWIHKIIFPYKKTGYFVELGAAEGIETSSCYFLEQLGWRGICVEPSFSFFDRLSRNRPLAICENVCITGIDGFVDFQEEGYLSRVVKKVYGFDRRLIKKPSMTLKTLLQKHAAPKTIDFLAMDVERSELNIMRAFPFEEYHILAIAMEGDSANKLLLDNGFIRTYNPFNTKSPWEAYYVHQSIRSQCSL